MENVIKFLKAIFFLALSCTFILIGGVISGGQYNGVSVFLFVLGLILLLIGIILGISAFSNDEEKKR